MSCPGSVRMSAAGVRTPSKPALQGTACHYILHTLLRGDAPPKPGAWIAVDEDDSWTEVEVTEEMLEWAGAAADQVGLYVASLSEKVEVYVERRIAVGKAFGCPDELWGTADVVIPVPGERTLVVADAKFGYDEVEVEANPQISLYAIGLAEEYGWRHDHYRLAILQPRSAEPVKVEEVPRAALMDRARRYRAAVDRALAADAPLVPSDEACRWCPAAGRCPARQERALALARQELAEPETLSEDALVYLLDNADRVRSALAAAEAYAARLLRYGKAVAGWKLVAGKTQRRWRDEAEAAEALKLLGVNPYAEPKLLTPAAAARLLKGKTEELDFLAVRPPGEPTLAREKDPRESVAPLFEPVRKEEP